MAEKRRHVMDPILVPLTDIFEDGESTTAVTRAVLKHMKLNNVEDLYIRYSDLCSTLGGSEAAFTKLGNDMQAAGLTMVRCPKLVTQARSSPRNFLCATKTVDLETKI